MRCKSLQPQLLRSAETWPSGRRHTPAKGAGPKGSRGFESLRLRHLALASRRFCFLFLRLPRSWYQTAGHRLSRASKLAERGRDERRQGCGERFADQLALCHKIVGDHLDLSVARHEVLQDVPGRIAAD